MYSKKSVFTSSATNTLYNEIFSGTFQFFLHKWGSGKQTGPVIEKIQSIFLLLCNMLWGEVEQDLQCVPYIITALNKQSHFVTYNKPFIHSSQRGNVKLEQWGAADPDIMFYLNYSFISQNLKGP